LADARAGMPAPILGERYAFVLHPDPDSISRGVRGLQRAGVPAFAGVPDRANADSVPLAAARGSVRVVTENGVYHGPRPASALTFALPAARQVLGLRFRCTFPEGVGPSHLARARLVWRSARDGAEHEQVQLVGVPADDTNPRLLSFWV